MWQVVELPAGIYNVTFANGLWRGIEVKAGETAVLEPGILEIKNAHHPGPSRIGPRNRRGGGRASYVKKPSGDDSLALFRDVRASGLAGCRG